MSDKNDNIIPLFGGEKNGTEKRVLKRLHRAFDPTCGYYLARALPGNQSGLAPGSVHHVAGLNWMAEMLELVDADTQQPPVYVARFDDVEIVARADNGEQPRQQVVGG